jgi:hypothetical protein
VIMLPRSQRVGVHGSPPLRPQSAGRKHAPPQADGPRSSRKRRRQGGPSAELNQRRGRSGLGVRGLQAIARYSRPCLRNIGARRAADQSDHRPRLPTPSRQSVRRTRPVPARCSPKHVTPPCSIGAMGPA